MEFNVLIGGEAGQGMFSVELELTELLSRLGYHFFATKNYMSRIRGGHNYHMVRVADRPVHALSGRPWDIIVAMDGGETERRHRPHLGEGGIFIGQDKISQIESEAKEVLPGCRGHEHHPCRPHPRLHRCGARSNPVSGLR